MIFVTVGLHSHGFNRLVETADAFAKMTNEKVLIQRGSSKYIPKHADHFCYADFDEMVELMKHPQVIVTHAGAGSIMLALQMSKPIVLVPRRKKYQEAIDDHQLELTNALCKSGQAVECSPVTPLGLAEAIKSAVKQTKKPRGAQELVKNLQDYLQSLE